MVRRSDATYDPPEGRVHQQHQPPDGSTNTPPIVNSKATQNNKTNQRIPNFGKPVSSHTPYRYDEATMSPTNSENVQNSMNVEHQQMPSKVSAARGSSLGSNSIMPDSLLDLSSGLKQNTKTQTAANVQRERLSSSTTPQPKSLTPQVRGMTTKSSIQQTTGSNNPDQKHSTTRLVIQNIPQQNSGNGSVSDSSSTHPVSSSGASAQKTTYLTRQAHKFSSMKKKRNNSLLNKLFCAPENTDGIAPTPKGAVTTTTTAILETTPSEDDDPVERIRATATHQDEDSKDEKLKPQPVSPKVQPKPAIPSKASTSSRALVAKSSNADWETGSSCMSFSDALDMTKNAFRLSAEAEVRESIQIAVAGALAAVRPVEQPDETVSLATSAAVKNPPPPSFPQKSAEAQRAKTIHGTSRPSPLTPPHESVEAQRSTPIHSPFKSNLNPGHSSEPQRKILCNVSDSATPGVGIATLEQARANHTSAHSSKENRGLSTTTSGGDTIVAAVRAPISTNYSSDAQRGTPSIEEKNEDKDDLNLSNRHKWKADTPAAQALKQKALEANRRSSVSKSTPTSADTKPIIMTPNAFSVVSTPGGKKQSMLPSAVEYWEKMTAEGKKGSFSGYGGTHIVMSSQSGSDMEETEIILKESSSDDKRDPEPESRDHATVRQPPSTPLIHDNPSPDQSSIQYHQQKSIPVKQEISSILSAPSDEAGSLRAKKGEQYDEDFLPNRTDPQSPYKTTDKQQLVQKAVSEAKSELQKEHEKQIKAKVKEYNTLAAKLQQANIELEKTKNELKSKEEELEKKASELSAMGTDFDSKSDADRLLQEHALKWKEEHELEMKQIKSRYERKLLESRDLVALANRKVKLQQEELERLEAQIKSEGNKPVSPSFATRHFDRIDQDRLTSTLEEKHEKEIADLKADLEKSKDELARVTGQLQATTEKLTKLEAQAAAAPQENVASLKNDLDRNKQELHQTKQELHRTQQELDTQVETGLVKTQEHEDMIRHLNDKLGEKEAKLSRLAKEMETEIARVAGQSTQGLQEKIESLQNALDEEKQQNSTKEATIQEREAALREKEALINEREKGLDAREKALDDREESLEAREKQLNAAKDDSKLDTVPEQADKSVNEKDLLDDHKTDSERGHYSRMKELEAMLSVETEKIKMALEQEHDSRMKELEAMVSEIEDQRAEIEETKKVLSEQQAELKNDKKVVREQSATNQASGTPLNSTPASPKKTPSKLRAPTSRLPEAHEKDKENLRKQVATLEKKLSAARDEHERALRNVRDSYEEEIGRLHSELEGGLQQREELLLTIKKLKAEKKAEKEAATKELQEKEEELRKKIAELEERAAEASKGHERMLQEAKAASQAEIARIKEIMDIRLEEHAIRERELKQSLEKAESNGELQERIEALKKREQDLIKEYEQSLAELKQSTGTQIEELKEEMSKKEDSHLAREKELALTISETESFSKEELLTKVKDLEVKLESETSAASLAKMQMTAVERENQEMEAAHLEELAKLQMKMDMQIRSLQDVIAAGGGAEGAFTILQEEKEGLLDQIRSLSDQLQQEQVERLEKLEEFRDLQQEKEGLLDQIRSLSDQLQQEQMERLDKLEEFREQHSVHVDKLKRDAAAKLDAAKKDAEQRIEDMQRGYKIQIEELQASLAAVPDGSSDEIAQLKEKEHELNSKIISLQYQMEEQKKLYDAKIKEVAEGHAKELEDLISQLDAVEAEHLDQVKSKDCVVEQKDEIITALSNQLQEALDRMKSSEAASKKVVESLQDDLKQARSEIGSLSEELKALREEHEKLLSESTDLIEKACEEAREEMIQRAEGQFKQANDLYVKLKKQYDASKEKAEKLSQELLEEKAKSEAATKEREEMEAQLRAELSELKTSSAQKAKEYRREMEGLLNAAEDFEKKSKEAESNAKSLQKKLTATLAEKAEIEQNLDSLMAEHQEMKQVCEELMAELEGR